MKTLYIVRHAKSDWDDPSADDFHRTLNKRGKRDAPYMGGILEKNYTHPQLILSSTAIRALTTATILAKELGYAEKKIQKEDALYLADVRTLLRYINAIDDTAECAMLVAHNPGVTDAVNYLADANLLNMPTCGIACLQFPFDSWEMVSGSTATLSAFEYPKKYISAD